MSSLNNESGTGGEADRVRLRQAADAGAAAERAEAGRAPGAHLHADDKDARRARGIPQLLRAHLPQVSQFQGYSMLLPCISMGIRHLLS